MTIINLDGFVDQVTWLDKGALYAHNITSKNLTSQVQTLFVCP